MEIIREYFLISISLICLGVFIAIAVVKLLSYYERKLDNYLKVRYKHLLKYSYLMNNRLDIYQDSTSVERSMLFLKFVFKNNNRHNFDLLIHFLDNLNYYLRTIENFSKELSDIESISDDILSGDVILREGSRLYDDLLEYKLKVISEFLYLEKYYKNDSVFEYKFAFIDNTRLDFKKSFNQLKAELHLLMPHIIMKVESVWSI